MTDDEKKLIQARHRLEEAQTRNRMKERKAWTRRLIQEGAVLESAMPQVRDKAWTNLAAIFGAFRHDETRWGASRSTGALSFCS